MKKLLMIIITLSIFTFVGCDGYDELKCREAVLKAFPEDTIYRIDNDSHIVVSNNGKLFYVYNVGVFSANTLAITPMLLVQEGTSE
jgi:hypothetical protein